MRAPGLLLLALAALLGAARGASDAPAEAPAPLHRLNAGELAAMQARLAALAQDVQHALATAPGAPAPANAKLEYLQDSLMVRSRDTPARQQQPGTWRELRRAARRCRLMRCTTCTTRRRRVTAPATGDEAAMFVRV